MHPDVPPCGLALGPRERPTPKSVLNSLLSSRLLPDPFDPAAPTITTAVWIKSTWVEQGRGENDGHCLGVGNVPAAAHLVSVCPNPCLTAVARPPHAATDKLRHLLLPLQPPRRVDHFQRPARSAHRSYHGRGCNQRRCCHRQPPACHVAWVDAALMRRAPSRHSPCCVELLRGWIVRRVAYHALCLFVWDPRMHEPSTGKLAVVVDAFLGGCIMRIILLLVIRGRGGEKTTAASY